MPYYQNKRSHSVSKTAVATINFGHALGGETGTSNIVTVLAPWVTGGMTLTCSNNGITADHDPEDYDLEGVIANTQNIVPGVSFDVTATASNNTWGRYKIFIQGS